MKNYSSVYRQTLAIIPICLCEFSMGIGFGWLAPMVKKFLEDPNSEIKPTEEECSWIASLAQFGRTFGPLFSIFLLDILGRQIMIRIASVLFFILWLAILFTRSVMILCASFFLFGIGIGTCNAASAVYLGENCSPKIRGIFCSISVSGFCLASLFEYIIAAHLPYNTLAIVNLTMTFCCVLSTLLTIESPQFLILKGNFQRAEENLTWLRGTKNQDKIKAEFENIKSNIASEKLKKTSYRELFSALANYKSLIIVLLLNMAHSTTGNAVVFTYISIMFPANEFFTANQATVYFGISQFVFCSLSSLVIEKFNRRTLTLISFAAFLLCHSTAAYFLFEAETDTLSTLEGYKIWITFASICVFSGISAMLNSVVHMIRGELFPQSIKPIGSGLAISAHSFMEFVTIKIFLMIKAQYGIYMNFLGYAVVSLVSFWFSYFALPETRGKTLIEIQKSLERQD